MRVSHNELQRLRSKAESGQHVGPVFVMDLIDDIGTLVSENAELRKSLAWALSVVARDHISNVHPTPLGLRDGLGCDFCETNTEHTDHEPTCPYLRAKELLCRE